MAWSKKSSLDATTNVAPAAGDPHPGASVAVIPTDGDVAIVDASDDTYASADYVTVGPTGDREQITVYLERGEPLWLAPDGTVTVGLIYTGAPVEA